MKGDEMELIAQPLLESRIGAYCWYGTHGVPRKEGRRPSLIRILPLYS